ncbi:MAG: SDR family NAD(P)-dependent oxidoreductase, partial [Gemmatimonadota bacterium]|nr:SDR family NAD(P)-dependent oxidoreductase [Gemmatimonadota bacterium]
MFSLEGLVALVTGAGSQAGIGFATAKLLSRAGAWVAITSTTARIVERTGELTALGGRVSGHVADLTDTADQRRLVEAVQAALGPVDILVNNAGMTQVGGPEITGEFGSLTDRDWELTMERNLFTAIGLTRALLPDMLEEGFGRIINVSSVTGPLVANPRSAPYAAAKAAMVGLTRALALETARKGVTVNAVAPGWIATASSTDLELLAGTNTPARRPGTPNEVAALIGFLASREA